MSHAPDQLVRCEILRVIVAARFGRVIVAAAAIGRRRSLARPVLGRRREIGGAPEEHQRRRAAGDVDDHIGGDQFAERLLAQRLRLVQAADQFVDDRLQLGIGSVMRIRVEC